MYPAAAGASGYGYSFMSKGAAKKGNKKYSFKSVKNGRVIMARRQAPHMAGQVGAAWHMCWGLCAGFG